MANRVPRRARHASTVFVALLRGVNVGGNNMIRMPALKVSFEAMGFAEVTTYINSGNVVFRASGDARKLELDIEAMLSREHRLDCKVVVRSLSEMSSLVEGLPADWNGDRRWRYYVLFLRHTIDSEQLLDRLHPKDGVEQVVYRPGALLWSALISELTRSSVAKVASQPIYRDMTIRNLNTTRQLYELMKKIGA